MNLKLIKRRVNDMCYGDESLAEFLNQTMIKLKTGSAVSYIIVNYN